MSTDLDSFPVTRLDNADGLEARTSRGEVLLGWSRSRGFYGVAELVDVAEQSWNLLYSPHELFAREPFSVTATGPCLPEQHERVYVGTLEGVLDAYNIRGRVVRNYDTSWSWPTHRSGRTMVLQ